MYELYCNNRFIQKVIARERLRTYYIVLVHIKLQNRIEINKKICVQELLRLYKLFTRFHEMSTSQTHFGSCV